jgi:hypothetical protein
MVPLEEIFCLIDDFCKHFHASQSNLFLPNPQRVRKRPSRLTLSEIMTILVLFQFSHYRTFKDFYLSCLSSQYKSAFPKLTSYTRFLELMPFAVLPFMVFLNTQAGSQTGRYFIDSTKLSVCDNLRIRRHQVFRDIARRGKTSTGWFFGFKLHLILNDQGEIMQFCLTSGNRDDRAVVDRLTKNLQGWLFGDRGYVGHSLKQRLYKRGLELITKVKRNMKPINLDPVKKQWLNKRHLIETVIGQLKTTFHLQHTRHRSLNNFLTHVLATLCAYVLKPNKTHVSFNQHIIQKNILISS